MVKAFLGHRTQQENIIRMNWFDLALIFKGIKIKQAVAEFNQVIQLNGPDLLKYQEIRKKAILDFHANKNKFYLAFLRENGVNAQSNWHDLPILTKKDWQVPLTERLSEGYSENNIYKNNTSGSSGTPFYFAKDKFCHGLTWASVKYRYLLHGIDLNHSWQARFYGIPLSRIKYLREKLKDQLGKRVRFPVFNLNDATCSKYVKEFRNKPFEYLNGYTSSLVIFARHCISKNIVLKNHCETLKICITTSEICTPEDRQIMEQGFGIKVVNEYGCAELDLLAFEDKDGDWVLNEENLFIELVDEEGRPVADGEEGKIVVTSLYNQAMPFIRYELGDRGIMLQEKTKNGRRILKQLTGRTNDVAILPSGRKVPGLTFYYVTKALLEKGGQVKECIVKQHTPQGFELVYCADAPLDLETMETVKKAMDQYLEKGLTITFTKTETIERTRMGKFKQFYNLMKQ